MNKHNLGIVSVLVTISLLVLVAIQIYWIKSSIKLKQEDFEWYLDMRRYGSFPHSGFGLGVERTVAWICGLQHVRETIPFPRLYGRNYP